MAEGMTPAQLASIKIWCSDNLPKLLGFTDSALAGFLVDVALSGGDGGKKKKMKHDSGDGAARRVLQTLRESGVRGKEGRLLSFATELCQRCGSVSTAPVATSASSVAAATSSTARHGSMVTNAQLLKRAANYSLMEEEPELKLPTKKPMKDGQ